MKKFVMGVLCALLLSVVAFAEVPIPQNKRVKNFDSGCCVWCAVENLGNIHGVDALKGLAKYRHDNYSNKRVLFQGGYMIDPWGRLIQTGPMWRVINEAPGMPERVHEEFKRLNISYKMQLEGYYNTTILKEAVDKKLGCAVGVFNYPGPGDYHMITLTHLDDKKFVFVDNNEKCERFEKTRQWFNVHWSGYTILVYPALPNIKKVN